MLAGAIGLGIVAAGAGFFVLRAKAVAEHPELDPVTLCPVDGPLSVTVVVVDKTDPVSEITRRDIEKRLQDYSAAVPRHGELLLYAIDKDSGDYARPIFHRCNPGSADDVDSLTGSKELAQKRFDAEFSEPLKEELSELLSIEEAPTSPIMEGVQSAAVEAFNGRRAVNIPKRLIIISDFAQNSERLSLYGKKNVAVDARGLGLIAPLIGVQVDLVMIRRPRAGFESDRILDVWTKYVRASKGRLGPTIELTGAN